MSDGNKNSVGINRRTVLKSSAAAGLGALGIFGAPTAQAASAPHTWEATNQITTQTDKKVTLASAVHYQNSAIFGTHWTHEFLLAGHGVSTDLDVTQKERDMNRNIMRITESDDCLTTLAAIDANGNRMYPKPDNDNGDAFGTVTAALSAAAGLLGSTVGSFVLAAPTLADGLLDAFTSTTDTTGKKEWIGLYDTVDEVGHHLEFSVKEAGTCSSWTDHMTVESQAGYNNISWDIAFSTGDVTTSSSVLSTEDSPEWGHPESMTKEERDHFGVTKVTASDLPLAKASSLSEGESLVTRVNSQPVKMNTEFIDGVLSSGSGYIATNAPAQVSYRTANLE